MNRLRAGWNVLALVGLLLAAAPSPALADPPTPALTGRVNDFAGLLDHDTIINLAGRLESYETSTTNQVAVVTLPDLKGYPIEDWGIALGRGWGIGQKGKDNGVLLIVAPNERKVRIEVGYGLEGTLPDATANEIIQSEILPKFKAGDMPGGIEAGVDGILAALGGTYAPSQPLFGDNGRANLTLNRITPLFFVGLFVFMMIVTGLSRKWDPKRKRNAWSWRMSRTGVIGGFLGAGSSSGGFGGGFSGGGFSGGGGGFGGGGASGSW